MEAAAGLEEGVAGGGEALAVEAVVELAALVAEGSAGVALVALVAEGLAEAVVEERAEKPCHLALHGCQRGQNYSAAARGSREPTAHARHFQ
jgi:hypothetical protein